MPAPSLPRENHIGHVRHPDPLRVVGSAERVLVDDETTRRIQRGDATLAWPGDDRLALYLNVPARRYELWRLEHDHVYRVVAVRAADTVSVVDLVPQLIMRLVAHDTRRGFDVVADVETANAAAERELERQRAEHAEDFADRLKHALVKDGVD